MLNDRTVRGTNFTCIHTGPNEEWTTLRLEPPDVPMPTRGKLFARNFLGSAGLEMSLNVLPPDKGTPFLHRHRENNDEVYVVLGGRGRFVVDAECIDVAEGSVLRLGPTAARGWRKNSNSPLYFLYLQYRADSVVRGGALDARRSKANPNGRTESIAPEVSNEIDDLPGRIVRRRPRWRRLVWPMLGASPGRNQDDGHHDYGGSHSSDDRQAVRRRDQSRRAAAGAVRPRRVSGARHER